MFRLLVVEDDRELNKTVCAYLSQAKTVIRRQDVCVSRRHMMPCMAALCSI